MTTQIPPFWQTQNRALAITLATCGVPFAVDETGQPVPFVHIYDAASLRQYGSTYKGLPLKEAARRAFHAGHPGVIVYCFQRTPLLDRVCKAYDTAAASITGSQAAPLHLPHLQPEDVAAICAQFTKNRNAFTEGWKTARPYIRLEGETREERTAHGTTFIGSFRLEPLLP